MARLIANNASRTIDAGKVDDEIFVNSAGFGFDAEVVVITNRPGARTGKLMYVMTALSQLFNYRGFDARITPHDANNSSEDMRRTLSARWLTLVFANGGYFGGAFRIAPAANVADGQLDSVFIRDLPTIRRLSVFARALSGRHTSQPEVGIGRNSAWKLEFPAPPVYQVDGELRQAVSATVMVSVLPKALRIVCPT